uniref:Glutamine synthetase catalytic subunit n=1 Tax=uncultured bacterium Contig29 TaxID=1393550 RepID=W0FI04_9BACT|nr:glutamine synthetase catalytic subunit [uncultured bacterium Contig29]
MNYTEEEVLQFVQEEDVKFIRLAFCDIYGKPKNVSIMPDELRRAFSSGIAIDASAIPGFGTGIHSDLFLHPDPDTLSVLPWRPEHGRVIRMFCSVSYPDGTPYENDTRTLLKKTVKKAADAGFTFFFGPEMEFYLFELDENGNRTRKTYDQASYMDIAPDDKGENVRREICLTLEKMGIYPESSHHEEGPGQNEIDFRYSDALSSADNAVTFMTVVKTVAARNGLYADFSPKPLPDLPGNGMHINLSVRGADGSFPQEAMMAGIMDKIRDITLFLNPSVESYKRLGGRKAPGYISWSRENRSQLIRVPAASGEYARAELRSPDPGTNPYLAYTLLIEAALYGITGRLSLPPEAELDFQTASGDQLCAYNRLPASREEAASFALSSSFVASCLPARLIDSFASAQH